MTLTRQQRIALKLLWDRSGDFRYSLDNRYLAFRRSVFWCFGNIAFVHWCGSIVRIEPDGHELFAHDV